MGKGDRKTKKGKIWRGSNGKSRPKYAKKDKKEQTSEAVE
jgi:30S ribosomal protein S31